MDGSPSLNRDRRAADLEWLAAGNPVDVLVVGAGITGAGVALDAASRGMSVALIERGDFAIGTSGASSKLVHSGLRYLVRGQIDVVWESATERALLMRRIAPHLTRPLTFLVPLYGGRAEAAVIRALLRAGDALILATRIGFPLSRRISPDEALRIAPVLRRRGLKGAILYWDGQLEDDVRLVVGVARTAAAHGARIVTYCAALGVGGEGVRARDALDGGEFEVKARHVVNATGVWAGALEPQARIRPSRGAHVLVRSNLHVALTVPQALGRAFMAIPSQGLAIIGPTDAPADDAEAEAAEVDILLEGMSRALEHRLTREDVVGRYAGLRPLLAAGADTAETADLSRRHTVIDNDGVLTLVGGKLTTYRRMAQDAVDRIASTPCRTRNLPLIGASGAGTTVSQGRLRRRYGSEADFVAERWPELLRPVVDGHPALLAEFAFGTAHELALTAEDLVDRRTRIGSVDELREPALAAARDLLATWKEGP